MNRLLNTEIIELLDRIMEVKACYDSGGERIVEIVSDYSTDPCDYECNAMEDLYSLPELIGMDYLDYNAEPVDDYDSDETAGERLVFQSDDMTAYYKLLRKLKRLKLITNNEYKHKIDEMERLAHSYISLGPYYSFDYYVPCEIAYTTSRTLRERLDVYFDYNCGYSLFSILCGVVALMGTYTKKLNELKEQYCGEKPAMEAA